MLLIYKTQEIAIQWHMAEVLESTEACFEELSLSDDEYHKALIDKDELLISGKVYDIKSLHKSGERVVITAMEDKEEESVLRNIRKVVNSNGSKNIPDELLSLLTITYILPSTHSLSFCLLSLSQNFGASEDLLLYYAVGIIVPPPDRV